MQSTSPTWRAESVASSVSQSRNSSALLWDEMDEDHFPTPAVEAYWTAFGLVMRRAGLTFVDLLDLADQEVA